MLEFTQILWIQKSCIFFKQKMVLTVLVLLLSDMRPRIVTMTNGRKDFLENKLFYKSNKNMKKIIYFES